MQLLKKVPSINKNGQQNSLRSWKQLQPLTVKQILEQSNMSQDYDFEQKDIEFKKIKNMNRTIYGQFKRGTNIPHGIARIIFDSN